MEVFSKDSYVGLIKLAEGEGFQFRGFQEENLGQRTIYLRHDVDYSLSMAVELARINASLGVRGTFFVLLRSQIYNLLSHWALDQVKEILASGQRVAFHCALPASIPANHESMASIVFNDFYRCNDALWIRWGSAVNCWSAYRRIQSRGGKFH